MYEAVTALRLKPVTHSTRIEPYISHKYKHKIPQLAQGQRDGSAGKSCPVRLTELHPRDPSEGGWEGLIPESWPLTRVPCGLGLPSPVHTSYSM